jgi:putative flippase GtrA
MKLLDNLLKITFIRFVFVGVLSTIINFTVFYFCAVILDTSVTVAAIIGYISGLLFSFVFGKNWVFLKHDLGVSNTFFKFFLVYLIGLGLHTILTSYLDTVLDYRIAWLLGTITSTTTNFIGSKHVVFR